MAHLYDGKAARELVKKILAEYISAFLRLKDSINSRYGERLHLL